MTTAKEKTSIGVLIEADLNHLTIIENTSIVQNSYDLKQMLKIAEKSKHVVTGLHGQDILYKSVELPDNKDKKKIEESIKWQFYDIEASDYKFIYRKIKQSNPIPNNEEIVKYLCAAIPNKMIDDFIEKNTGIYTGLDLKPFAVWRGYKASNDGDGAVILIVHGPETITVVGGQEDIEFVREFSASLNVELETKRTIDHFKQAFNAADVKVEELEEPIWTITYGYAIAHLDIGFINILPEKHKRIRTKDFKKPRMVELIAALAVLFFIASVIPYSMARNMDKETEEIENSIQQMSQIIHEVDSIQKEINEYREYIKALSTHEKHYYAPIINDIRIIVPHQVALSQLSLAGSTIEETAKEEAGEVDQEPTKDANKGTEDQLVGITDFTAYEVSHISISAKSLGIKPMGLFLDNMTQLPYMQSVEIKNIVQQTPGYYTFNITAEIKQ